MASGVGKSGSPAPKPITGRPAALSAFALASTARVADSLIAPIRAEMREAMRPSWHCRTGGVIAVPPDDRNCHGPGGVVLGRVECLSIPRDLYRSARGTASGWM